MKKSVEMTLTKSTKGTHVYGNSSPDAAVSTIYIKKSALPNTAPAKIKLDISFEGEVAAVNDEQDEDLVVE